MAPNDKANTEKPVSTEPKKEQISVAIGSQIPPAKVKAYINRYGINKEICTKIEQIKEEQLKVKDDTTKGFKHTINVVEEKDVPDPKTGTMIKRKVKSVREVDGTKYEQLNTQKKSLSNQKTRFKPPSIIALSEIIEYQINEIMHFFVQRAKELNEAKISLKYFFDEKIKELDTYPLFSSTRAYQNIINCLDSTPSGLVVKKPLPEGWDELNTKENGQNFITYCAKIGSAITKTENDNLKALKEKDATYKQKNVSFTKNVRVACSNIAIDFFVSKMTPMIRVLSEDRNSKTIFEAQIKSIIKILMINGNVSQAGIDKMISAVDNKIRKYNEEFSRRVAEKKAEASKKQENVVEKKVPAPKKTK
jgi:hypothetical protein